VKCFEITGRRVEKDCLKHYYNYSEFVRLVPPLRGWVTLVTLFPPLPRWATVFRPWRDSAVNAMKAGSGVVGDVMDPASGLRGETMRAASDVAVMR
jgi:hypothetical protein